MKYILMVGFSGILGAGQVEDRKMIKDRLIDGKNCEQVQGLKDAGSKFDDYSSLPKIRQILLYWGYELTEKDFLMI